MMRRSHASPVSCRAVPAVALSVALSVAACDDGGNGPAVSEPADNVRAAAAAMWPSEAVAEIPPEGVSLTRTNLVAILDMSGSMAESYCAGAYRNRADAARAALVAWLDSVPLEANMGLVVFAKGDVSLRVPLGGSNHLAFVDAVMAAEPGGDTPLQEALSLARRVLETQAARQRGYGEYRIVVITDGQHSDGQDPAPVIEAIYADFANPIEIHTIGFCIESSALNRPGVTYYRSANDPDELSRGLESAIAEAETFDMMRFDGAAGGEGQ